MRQFLWRTALFTIALIGLVLFLGMLNNVLKVSGVMLLLEILVIALVVIIGFLLKSNFGLRQAVEDQRASIARLEEWVRNFETNPHPIPADTRIRQIASDLTLSAAQIERLVDAQLLAARATAPVEPVVEPNDDATPRRRRPMWMTDDLT